MSIELVAWALRQKIDDPLKVTLTSLANRAKGPEGCWPKIRLIAEDTTKSERTIKRHIEALISLGLITTERRKTYLIYRFCLGQEVTSGVTSESHSEKCHEVSPQEVPSGVTSHRKENRKKDLSSLRSESARAQNLIGTNVVSIETARAKARKTAIPEDFEMTPAFVEMLAAKGYAEEEIRDEWDNFKDHHNACGNTFKRPDLAARKWARNCKQPRSRQTAYGRGGPEAPTVFRAAERLISRIQAARGDDGGDEVALPF